MSFRRIVKSLAFTRPANTTQYAVGDLLANNVTAGSVVPIALDAARYPGGNGVITAVSLTKSGAVLTDAAFRVHLFTQAPIVSNGDNGVFAVTNGIAKGYLGSVDVTMIAALGDGARGRTEAKILFDTEKPAKGIFALIELLDTYTPVSAESFTLALELDLD